MRRRKLLIGVGGLAGGSGILGTGAFTSVSAERSVSVSVADDDAAFLKLTPSDGPNGAYATTTNGQLELDFTGTDAGGGGLGTDSTYRFDDVFEVTNQGTQPVGVWLSVSGSTFDDDNLWFYQDGAESSKLQGEGDGVVEIDPGAGVSLGVYVDTHGLDTDTWDVDVTVHADASEDGVGVTCPVAGENELLVSNADDCGEYSSIDEAVENAEDGDTVLVHDYGTYSGSGIWVDEVQSDLTIKGADGRKPNIEQTVKVPWIPEGLNLTLQDLSFPNTSTDALSVGGGTDNLHGTGTESIKVKNCVMDVNRAMKMYNADIDSLTLSNVEITHSNTYPILCSGSNISNVTISNCNISYLTHGIKLDKVGTLNIESSLIKAREDAGPNEADTPGIKVNVTSSATIGQSTIQFYSESGIKFGGVGYDADIKNSSILDNGQSPDGNFSGIVIDGDKVDVDITDSNIVGNTKYGIEQLDSKTGSVVADGCHFRDNDAGEANDPVAIENRVGDGDPSDEIESAGYQWD
ncbi:right-handed parallel beta-helix repeat-containing protein [Halorientalis salina]|uniref:right-handed parallel beta-helix repeat-containing protein n=1 Tax=Halorientalis salina TaxID=2932266 RepID=UPI0010AD207B|nr:right-handed parallel beta-helix repeat-containing protein [Halorientalis salina]